MSRGVLYMVWPGEGPTQAMLDRSIASLRKVHPELPVHVANLPAGSTLLDKAKMYDLSPFDETLFLDADTVVMERLDFGFNRAKHYGLACCICECPWAKRFTGLADHGDIVEYNTGVVFFSKSYRGVWHVFKGWQHNAPTIDSGLYFMSDDRVKTLMPVNDQASFAFSVHALSFNPFVLPLNWNFRHRWQKTVFGPIKVWHDYDDVPENVKRWNEAQSKPDAVIQCGRVA
jgi:hypothetical protein